MFGDVFRLETYQNNESGGSITPGTRYFLLWYFWHVYHKQSFGLRRSSRDNMASCKTSCDLWNWVFVEGAT